MTTDQPLYLECPRCDALIRVWLAFPEPPETIGPIEDAADPCGHYLSLNGRELQALEDQVAVSLSPAEALALDRRRERERDQNLEVSHAPGQ